MYMFLFFILFYSFIHFYTVQIVQIACTYNTKIEENNNNTSNKRRRNSYEEGKMVCMCVVRGKKYAEKEETKK